MIPQGSQTYTTISPKLYNKIRRRVTSLRRMTLPTLLALCHEHYEQFDDSAMQNKGDTFQYILQAEYGWKTIEAYNAQAAKRKVGRKPRQPKLL